MNGDILLTGATGFLGGHLLLFLLRHSDSRIYCLARRKNNLDTAERLSGLKLLVKSKESTITKGKKIGKTPFGLRNARIRCAVLKSNCELVKCKPHGVEIIVKSSSSFVNRQIQAEDRQIWG